MVGEAFLMVVTQTGAFGHSQCESIHGSFPQCPFCLVRVGIDGVGVDLAMSSL